MQLIKIFYAIFVINSFLCAMEDGNPEKPGTSYSQLINAALLEEKNTIYESSTLAELHQKVSVLSCPFTKAKVKQFIESDLIDLQDAVQTSDFDSFKQLVKQYFRDGFNFSQNKPIIRSSYSEESDDDQTPVVAFSDEFIDHINTELARGNAQTRKEFITNFKRVQLYCEYLEQIADFETLIADSTQVYLASLPCVFVPFQIMSITNPFSFALATFAQATQSFFLTNYEQENDLCGHQASHAILNSIRKLRALSQQSSQQLIHNPAIVAQLTSLAKEDKK